MYVVGHATHIEPTTTNGIPINTIIRIGNRIGTRTTIGCRLPNRDKFGAVPNNTITRRKNRRSTGNTTPRFPQINRICDSISALTNRNCQILRCKSQITHRKRDSGIQDRPSTTSIIVRQNIRTILEGQIPFRRSINSIQCGNRRNRRTIIGKHIIRSVKHIISTIVITRIGQNIAVEIRSIKIVEHFDNFFHIHPKEPVKRTCNTLCIYNRDIDAVISKRKLRNNTIPRRTVINRIPHAIIVNSNIQVLSTIITRNKINRSIL